MQTAAKLTKSFDTDLSVLEQIRQATKSNFCDDKLPVVDVQIPQTVTIDCPLARPGLRQASKCKACPYFHGIAQTSWSDDSELSWSHKYGIRCGLVLVRKTRQLVTE